MEHFTVIEKVMKSMLCNIKKALFITGATAFSFLTILRIGIAQNNVLPLPKQPVLIKQHPSAYQRLQARYLAGIGADVLKKIEFYSNEQTESRNELETSGKALKSQVQSTIRTLTEAYGSGRAGQIKFDGETPLRSTVVLSSAESAQIYVKLDAERVVDFSSLLEELTDQVGDADVDKAWTPLLTKFRQQFVMGSKERTDATMLLYLASRDASCQNELYELAVKNGNVGAASLLLFEGKGTPAGIPDAGTRLHLHNPQNGTDTYAPVSSSKTFQAEQNTKKRIVNSLSAKNQLPESQVLCAIYLARNGDKNRATKICQDVLEQNYVGFGLPAASVPESDLALSRAKTAAMLLLFYEIRTPAALRVIYDRSRLQGLEREKHTSEPDESWKPYDSYIAGREEIEFAKSLISSISRYNQNMIKASKTDKGIVTDD